MDRRPTLQLIRSPATTPAGAGRLLRRALTAPVLLFGVALALRLLAAWQLEAITVDGLVYIASAAALGSGDYGEAFQVLGFNLYPVVLMLLNRAGLPWEVAGEVWGVAVGSLAVFPLFDWLQRQFDREMAIAGAFVYAVHPYLVEKSPELIRDPTFWCLWLAGLSLLWRSVSEGRLGLYVAAGVTMTLAAHTRIEGWLLFVALITWTVPHVLRRGPGRVQRLVGASACAACVPLLWLVLNFVWLSGHPPFETGRLFRADVFRYVQERVGGGDESNGSRAAARGGERAPHSGHAPPRRDSSAASLYADALARAFGPVGGVLVLCGLGWHWFERRGWWTLVLLAALLLAAAGLFQATVGAISSRYFATLVVLALPTAAAGVLRIRNTASRLAVQWLSLQPITARRIMSVSLAALLLGSAGGKLTRPGHDTRTAQARFGKLLADRWGPGQTIVGPRELALVGHYAQAKYHTLPPQADLPGFLAAARSMSADILLLPDALWPAEQGRTPPAHEPIRWCDGTRTYLAVPIRTLAGARRPAGPP